MLGRGFKPGLGKQGFLDTKTKKNKETTCAGFLTKKILWRSHKVTAAAIMEKRVNSLVKVISREGAYQPFRMKW